jgi:hypothetical protein
VPLHQFQHRLRFPPPVSLTVKQPVKILVAGILQYGIKPVEPFDFIPVRYFPPDVCPAFELTLLRMDYKLDFCDIIRAVNAVKLKIPGRILVLVVIVAFENKEPEKPVFIFPFYRNNRFSARGNIAVYLAAYRLLSGLVAISAIFFPISLSFISAGRPYSALKSSDSNI